MYVTDKVIQQHNIRKGRNKKMSYYEEYLRKEQEKKIKEYEKNACRITPDEEPIGEAVKRYYNIHRYI